MRATYRAVSACVAVTILVSSIASAQNVSSRKATSMEARLNEIEQHLQKQSQQYESTIKELAEENTRLRIEIANLRKEFAVEASGVDPVLALQTVSVQRNDTVFKLARRFGVSAEEIIEANELRDPSRIYVGQQLVVPVTTLVALQETPQPASPEVKAVSRRASQQPQQVRAAAQTPITVGEEPPVSQTNPRFDLFSDRGGILTPRGTFVVEPSLRFATTSDNRFFFSGAEIVDALLIGVIEARDTDRSSVTASIGTRYGITSRLEVDLTTPFVTQTDRRSDADIQTGDGESSLKELSASGIGDVSFGLHYQLNQGNSSWPYVIANLRAKAPTGTGPFDIAFDEQGNPLDATTGSGYWSIEPSLTLIKRVDPVALFGNIGYQYNLETDIDKIIGTLNYQSFDPGDTIRTSYGIGISLNEDVSLNFGYDQSYVLKSTSTVLQDVNGVPTEVELSGETATIGSFLFGIGYRPTPAMSYSLSTTVGATDSAPDASISIRTQFTY